MTCRSKLSTYSLFSDFGSSISINNSERNSNILIMYSFSISAAIWILRQANCMPTPVGVNWKKRELGLGRREKKTLTQQELELFARTFLDKSK